MCGFWRYRPHWPACASKEENNIMERKFWQVTPVQVGRIVMDRSGLTLLLVHPFLIILKPAVAMSAQPDSTVALVAVVETLLFLAVGLWLAKYRRYE